MVKRSIQKIEHLEDSTIFITLISYFFIKKKKMADLLHFVQRGEQRGLTTWFFPLGL